MSDWRVSKEIVEVKEHSNADQLDVLKVGGYQMVSGKGNYRTGDEVVIIPEKSIIPKSSPIYEEYEKYLTGPNKDRVKAIRLRGEYSEAITWPIDKLAEAADDYENYLGCLAATIGEDISDYLGITKYEAPIPYEMKGEVEAFEGYARHHDVFQYASYADELTGEVIITEKIHGSQINYFLSNGVSVSSKGLLKRGLRIKESDRNLYWQAAKNSGLLEIAVSLLYDPTDIVQLIGEVIPVQKGYNYDQDEKIVLLFEAVVNGKSIPYKDLPNKVKWQWVPVLYRGLLEHVDLQKLSRGKEQVSGNESHIREGIVVKSVNDEKAEDGTRLILKVINPKYKDEDSFN